MKNHPSGFVPVNFQDVGKVFLAVGIFCILVFLFGFLTGVFSLPSIVLYFGLGSFILSIYLIFVVPKEK